MKIICPGCSAEYSIDENRIPPEGMKATCPRCMSSWVVQAGQAAQVMPTESSGLEFPDSTSSAEIPVSRPPPPPSSPPPPRRGALDDVDDVDEEDETERSINLFGRSFAIPEIPFLDSFLNLRVAVILIVSLVVGGLTVSKFIGLRKDLKVKKAGWSQVDYVAVGLKDLWDANLPLKDDIVPSGSYQENFNAGFSAFNQDTYKGYQEAETYFRKAAKIERKSALSIALLGEVYARLHGYANALSSSPQDSEFSRQAWLRIDRAVRLKKDLSEAYRAWAEYELANRNYPKAKEKIDQAIKLKNNEAQNYLTQGRIEFAQGETDLAQSAFQKAVDLNKSLSSAHYYLGMVLEKSADYTKAENEFQQALELSPGHPRALLGLAQLKLERFNLIEESLALLNKVLEENKDKSSPQEIALAKYYLARSYEQLGDLNKSLATVQEARKTDARSTRLILYEAHLQQKLDPTFQAEAFVDGLIKEDMQDADYFLYKGGRLSSKGSYADAIALFNKVVSMDPSNARAYYELARNYELNLDPEKALDAYQKSLRADRGFGDAYVKLATLQISKNKFDDALKLLDEVNSRNDRIASVHNLMGVIALKKSDLPKAKQEFSRSLEIDLRFADAHRNLADCFLQEKNLAQAEKYAGSAKELDPDSKETQFLFGRLYEASGRFNEAQGIYEKVLSREPKSIDAFMGVARSAIGKKDWAKAQSALSKAIELDETNSRIFFLLGTAYFEMNKYDEAQQALQNAQRFDPKNPEIFIRMGEVNLESNRITEAVAALKEAISLNPDHFEANGLLGRAYLRLNARQDAMGYFEKQLKLAKDNNTKSDIYYMMGDAVKQDSPEDALQNYERAYRYNKKNARALYGIGTIHEDNNQIATAVKVYLAAASADRSYAIPHRHLGYIYANQNRKAAALKEFQIYLKLDPNAKDRDEIREQMGYLR